MSSQVIAVIGAGGKTTWIKNTAKELRDQGRKVLVCTFTHMLACDCTLCDPTVESIAEQLKRDGYCMTGTFKPGDKKMTALPEDIYLKACEYADVVLVEADGAKHYSVKYPALHEPVIPDNTTEIVLIMGTFKIGEAASEQVFRYSILKEHLDYDDNAVISMKMIDDIVDTGYGPVFEAHPEAEKSIYYSEFVQGELKFNKR